MFRVTHIVANAIAVWSDWGKGSKQNCVCGEGAGGENDVVEVVV